MLRASGCASMLCGCSEGAPGRRRLFGERLGIFVSRLPLQFFKYQSMPQKCRDIGDPQSCRETEGVPSAHLAVRWLFYYHPSSATSSIQLLLWHLQEPDASVAPPLEAARTGARTGQQHLAGDRASRRER